jgi:hypothetical protein
MLYVTAVPMLTQFVVPCGRGTVAVNRTCLACPAGTYSDHTGALQCSACPDGTFTAHDGASDAGDCMSVCGHGTFSASGLIPCQQCARNTFSGPPPPSGYRQCDACVPNTFTVNVGSTGPSQCLQPCAAGTFSQTGLTPCSECPINHYQPSAGQQRCIECANTTFTPVTGATAVDQCLPVLT